jgi:hypothetical protein
MVWELQGYGVWSFLKGKSCESYVDVDLHFISVTSLNEFMQIVGGRIDVLKLMLCKTKITYRKGSERSDHKHLYTPFMLRSWFQ